MRSRSCSKSPRLPYRALEQNPTEMDFQGLWFRIILLLLDLEISNHFQTIFQNIWWTGWKISHPQIRKDACSRRRRRASCTSASSRCGTTWIVAAVCLPDSEAFFCSFNAACITRSSIGIAPYGEVILFAVTCHFFLLRNRKRLGPQRSTSC